MADVGFWCEWEAEVEADPALLAQGVQWMVRRLVDECQEQNVAPVGELTIVARPVDPMMGFVTVRRAVNLAVDPAAEWEWWTIEPADLETLQPSGCLWQLFSWLVNRLR